MASNNKLVVAEKRPAIKNRGFGSVFFFHFFDWNQMLSKKKKKLFSNTTKLLLPSGSKKFCGDERMPKSKHLMIADEKFEGFPSSHKQHDLNIQMREPSPVAKLMGLDSMPVIHHKNPGKFSSMSQFSSNRHETLELKQSRPQKLQRTGGLSERRQQQQQPLVSSSSSKETMQSNRKFRRQHHHKLASPVKSPRLLSKRSSSRLMEVATKILEPGLQTRKTNAKCALTYGGTLQSIENEFKDGIFMKKCNVSINGSGVGPSKSFCRLNETMELKLRDEEVYVKENITSSFCNQTKIDAKRPFVNTEGKDAHAKINVENRARGLYMKDDNIKTNLRQNPAPLVKAKSVNGAKIYNRPLRRRNLGASESSISSCTHSKVEGNGLGMKNNNAPKRRPNDDLKSESTKVVSFTFAKPQNVRRELVNGKGKGAAVGNSSINQSSVKSESKNGSTLEGNGIVSSIIFSSPMRHSSTTARQARKHDNLIEKRRCTHKPNYKSNCPQKLVPKRDAHFGGDSLSALMDKKIKELNSLDQDQVDSAKINARQGRSTASVLEELISALKPTEEEEDALCSGIMSSSDQTISHVDMVKTNAKLQTEAEAGMSAAYLASDGDHPSPMSILEVSFSNDSSGRKPSFGSSETGNNCESLDFDIDLLDSASSFDIQKATGSPKKDSGTKDTHLHQGFFSDCLLNHSTEAMSNAKLLLDNFSVPNSDEKDLFLFNTLEGITKALKDEHLLKRLVSDCMIEWLASRYNCFLMSGSKISLLTKREVLSREVYEEIERWNQLAGKDVDEIFEKDLVSSKGMWTKFDEEVCESSVQIENDILHGLVGELVIDLCS